jgi:transcription initiation factor TFIIE subunit alpha
MNTLEDPVIREYLRKLISDEGLKIVESVPDAGEITDDQIAEKSKISLYSVRRTLFALYEKRMAEYRRERNDENGWLTYFWKLNFDDIGFILENETSKLARNLKQRLEFERENVFYTCKNDGKRFIFDVATKMDFRCPECSSQLEHFDNEMTVFAIEKRLTKLNGKN